MSQTAAEHEVTKLRKEFSDANAKLKNVANAVALDAEQRANQKVAHVTAQYEQRYSELRGSLPPKKVNPMSVEELVALLYHDSKCHFEFQCVAGHQKATRKGLAYWPVRIRAVQGHTKRAMDTAAASDAFIAVEIYASSGAAAIQRMNAAGKKITTADKCPGVIYHRTTKVLRDGFVAGGGERISSGIY